MKNKIEKDFNIIRDRFKKIDMVQIEKSKDNYNLEVYYNESWAFVGLDYNSKEDIDELVIMIKKEYSI